MQYFITRYKTIVTIFSPCAFFYWSDLFLVGDWFFTAANVRKFIYAQKKSLKFFMKTFVLHVFCNLIVRQFKTICVNLHLQNLNGSVAQLNRASDSGSEGRGFESHRNHQEVQLSQLHLFILGGYGIPAIPTQPQSQQSAAPFYFRAERLGREKVLKVVGLNPTGITMGCSLSRLHIFILGGYGIPAIPTQPADDCCCVLRRRACQNSQYK